MRPIIVLKIDIESFECRVISGSQNIFRNEEVYIPYILMEWTMLTTEKERSEGKGKTSNPNCPMVMLHQVVKILTENGYSPIKADKSLDNLKVYNAFSKWINIDVIWVHQFAHKLSNTLF